jgi:hypothetical protein
MLHSSVSVVVRGASSVVRAPGGISRRREEKSSRSDAASKGCVLEFVVVVVVSFGLSFAQAAEEE